MNLQKIKKAFSNKLLGEVSSLVFILYFLFSAIKSVMEEFDILMVLSAAVFAILLALWGLKLRKTIVNKTNTTS
jgi:hypothetical protein